MEPEGLGDVLTEELNLHTAGPVIQPERRCLRYDGRQLVPLLGPPTRQALYFVIAGLGLRMGDI